ncbi:MAG: tetratricopeptide repeat protein [Candidatus Schekmanbacteria bacterium]|nr:MAG: tetratricopeptide repeat protein [Candidatus Schekmanbacteria bacterium]
MINKREIFPLSKFFKQKICIFYLFVSLLFLMPLSAKCADNSFIDRDIKAGIDAIYNLDFDIAHKHMEKARRKNPDDPAPYFYTAMIYWGQLFFNYNLSKVDELDQWLDKTIEKAEKELKSAKDKSKAYFYLGGAYGFKARVSLIKHKWISAYLNARKGTKMLREAVKINPNNYEAYLGLGMYNYFVSRLPGVIKVLAFLLAVSGDREKGIEQLELCAEKGVYGAAEARLVLSSIYIYFEYSPEKALKHIKYLENKYPYNPRFIYMEGIAYSKLKKEKEGLLAAMKIENNIKKGIKNFTNIWKGRTEYLRGEIYFKTEKYNLALLHYNLAIASKEKLEKEDWVDQWSYMRIGMIYDVMGKRELAKVYYRKVLSINETNEENVYIKDYAQKYLSKPYNPSDKDKLE